MILFAHTGFSQQWVIYNSQNSPLKGTALEIIIDRANSKWMATDQGLARFKNNVWTVWDTTNSPLTDNDLQSIVKDKENNLWIATRNKGIFKFDGNNNWRIFYYTNIGFTLKAVNRLRVDEDNTVWVCSMTMGLLKHIQNDKWKWYHIGNSGIPDNSVNDLKFEKNIKWVATVNGGVGRFNDTSWTVYNYYNSPLESNWIMNIGIDADNNKWFCTTFGGVAKFNSNQNQWTIYTSTNSGLTYNNTSAIFIDNFNTKWIGIQGGGFVTYNDTTWNCLLAGNNTILDFRKDRYGNIWICTDGYLRVYNSTGVIGVNEIKENNPSGYQLFQNYPNPFNSVTQIKYAISKSSNVILKVYNILGKEISTLINQKQNSGNYQITFDANNLPSGIYFYELAINKTLRIVRKMILIK
jgi:Predicted periplasmic ligand-binding sensor domain